MEPQKNNDDELEFDAQEIENDVAGAEFIGETMDQSVAAIMEELGDEIPEANEQLQGRESEAEPKPEDISKAASTLSKSRKTKQKGKKVVEAAELEQEAQPQVQEQRIDPPQGWKVEEKEWFNKQPREAQQAILRREAERDAYFTKTSQELQRERQKYGECNTMLEHAATEWGLEGITVQQGLSQLLSMQKLLQTDARAGLAKIMALNGVTLQDLAEYQQNGQPQNNFHNYQQPQQNIPLTPEAVRQMILETQQEQQRAAQAQAEQQSLYDLLNEVDANGNYVYREAHDLGYIERVQPLVAYWQKTQPGISLGEALRRAVHEERSHRVAQNGSPSLPSPRLSQQQQAEKIKAASVSVRGRGSVSTPTTTYGPIGESFDDSARAILSMFND